MILHFHFLLVVQLLSACVMAPLGAMNYETDRKWNAYRLSGGPQAETGYRWLLVSQKSLEEIANLVETSIPISDEDSPAIWALTPWQGTIGRWSSRSRCLRRSQAFELKHKRSRWAVLNTK